MLYSIVCQHEGKILSFSTSTTVSFGAVIKANSEIFAYLKNGVYKIIFVAHEENKEVNRCYVTLKSELIEDTVVELTISGFDQMYEDIFLLPVEPIFDMRLYR